MSERLRLAFLILRAAAADRRAFRLDLSRRALSRNGVAVALNDPALDVLCALAEAQGEPVTKDALMARVSPGVAVEDSTIQVQVADLRAALGAHGGESHGLTVSGGGYRLVGAATSCRSAAIGHTSLGRTSEAPRASKVAASAQS
jgi:DNA-binding winged helix-turn-helix (wHTH) protein